MTRPKYHSGERTARERLLQAFWDYLGEKPFDKVTVADIVKRAGVNRNTFYYHFEDLSDLARTATQELTFDPGFIRQIVTRLIGGAGLEAYGSIPQMNLRIERMCLIAGRNSTSELRQMLRAVVVEAWSEAFGIDIDSLDTEGRIAIEFMLGGFMSAIAFRADTGADFGLEYIVEKGFNRDAMQFLRHIPQLQEALPAQEG